MASRYALIIAASEYRDERLRKLLKTEADAEGMRRVLVDDTLCGFAEEHVEVLLNEDDRAVRIAIERFFENRASDDLVLFYYAGHGIVDERRRLSLALSETNPDYRGTGLEAGWLREELEDCRARRQIVILDCCNAGAFADTRDAVSPAGIKEAFEGKGRRYVLTASDRLQFSFEKLEGVEAIKNGLFTHYLLQGLEPFAAAEAGGEVITVDSLFDYARERVTEATQNKQTPRLFVRDKEARLELARRQRPRIPPELEGKLAGDDYGQRLLAVYELKALVEANAALVGPVRMLFQDALERERDFQVREALGHCLRDMEPDKVTATPVAPIGPTALNKAAQDRYKPGAVFQNTLKDGGEGPKMVVIPAGKFIMGSLPSEPKRSNDEGPQHEARIERPFAIGVYAVTFEEYDRFAEATGKEKPGDAGWGRSRRPVIHVSWHDAVAYAQWLSEQTGATYRLPSEAEWEYAARAGTVTPFHLGERITTDQANFDGRYTYNGSAKGQYREKTVAVGSFPANAFGLHDVHGNVWEWVQDCWHDDYKGAPDPGRTRLSRIAVLAYPAAREVFVQILPAKLAHLMGFVPLPILQL